MKVYRIGDRRHPLFDGTGAFVHGGRWNSPGKRLIYAAQTYSGALLEQLAHGNIGRLPATQVYIEIDIPDDAPLERARPEEIPGWNAADMTASRARGDAWYHARASAVLLVPAAVTGGIESNVLISQEHANFGFLRASEPRPVIWDPRLFRT